ncbi:MAG: DUF262 domain-containing HNH endonuclease family protein [Nostoc sp. DedQUE12a]|nr:DUF262 domain-containing HNH endonuclease family protein [Nostoc sp. DedQUE12a]
MPVAIHATEKALYKVFSNDFAFSIPAYQRPYAWTKDQASDLLNDLLSFLGHDSEVTADTNPYFLGSIVLIKGEKPEADVIDGQQRLTTLTILLSVLRSLASFESASEITDYLYQKGRRFEGKENRYRLKIRPRDEDFFRKYIQDENGLDALLQLNPSQLTDSQRNIHINASYFLDKLKLLSHQQRDSFSNYLMTRCFLVLVSTPDLDSAYRIFSTLNARGLDLSLSDFLKSEIIGAIEPSQQDKYTIIWETEEEDLGREKFQELFAHIRMIDRQAKPRKTTLREFTEDILPNIIQQQNFIDEVLKPYSNAFKIINTANYQSDKDAKTINSLLRWLNQIDNFDWIPPAILYFSKNSHNPEKLKQFFTDLERLAAGLMILRADINDRIGRYAKLLAAIQENVDLYVQESPLQLTSDERNRIIKTLDGDLYLIKRIRQYVLLRLDSALSGGEASYDYSVITVEHVLPQNPSEGSKWLQWFPIEEERIQYVHRIGNLALLSRNKNSEAQNYDFDKKKEKYFLSKKGICPFVLTTQVLQQSEWTPEVIKQRQEDCLQNLRKLWRL